MTRWIHKLAALAVLMAAGCVPNADENAALPDFKVETYTLANGMQVILNPDQTSPLVHVQLRLKAGSRDDPPGKTGMALLAEHIMYSGAAPGQNHLQRLEEAGVRVRDGQVEGETALDATVFLTSASPERLSDILWLEANRLAQLRQKIPAEFLAAQIETVRALYEAPSSRRAQIYSALFPGDHPYHQPVSGNLADLERITPEDMQAYFRRHYAPSRILLTIGGSFSPPPVKQWVTQTMGSLPAGETVSRITSLPQHRQGQTLIETFNQQNSARLTLAWRGPPRHTVDALALELVADSFLEHALPSQGEISAFAESHDLAGTFVWEIRRQNSISRTEARSLHQHLLRRLRAIAKEGLDHQDFATLKRSRIRKYLGEIESFTGETGRLNTLSSLGEKWPHLNGLEIKWRSYRRLTSEDIRNAVQKYLTKGPAVMVVDNPMRTSEHSAEMLPPRPQNVPAATVYVPDSQIKSFGSHTATWLAQTSATRTHFAWVLRYNAGAMSRLQAKWLAHVLRSYLQRAGGNLSWEIDSAGEGLILTTTVAHHQFSDVLVFLQKHLQRLAVRDEDLTAGNSQLLANLTRPDPASLSELQTFAELHALRWHRLQLIKSAQEWTARDADRFWQSLLRTSSSHFVVVTPDITEKGHSELQRSLSWLPKTDDSLQASSAWEDLYVVASAARPSRAVILKRKTKNLAMTLLERALVQQVSADIAGASATLPALTSNLSASHYIVDLPTGMTAAGLRGHLQRWPADRVTGDLLAKLQHDLYDSLKHRLQSPSRVLRETAHLRLQTSDTTWSDLVAEIMNTSVNQLLQIIRGLPTTHIVEIQTTPNHPLIPGAVVIDLSPPSATALTPDESRPQRRM